ncbi:unnamed protein product, partial [Laminaria digitata]
QARPGKVVPGSLPQYFSFEGADLQTSVRSAPSDEHQQPTLFGLERGQGMSEATIVHTMMHVVSAVQCLPIEETARLMVATSPCRGPKDTLAQPRGGSRSACLRALLGVTRHLRFCPEQGHGATTSLQNITVSSQPLSK